MKKPQIYRIMTPEECVYLYNVWLSQRQDTTHSNQRLVTFILNRTWERMIDRGRIEFSSLLLSIEKR